jgi:hypothetical protein
MIHDWLKQTCVAYVPGPETEPLVEEFAVSLLQQFRLLGHVIQSQPDDRTDILITTAPYGKSISWRNALMFTGRVRFKYKHSPTVFTLIGIAPQELESNLAHFRQSLAKEAADPEDYDFPGLAPDAYKVLHDQGHRGGPILSLERLLQAQSKCINILLLVGDRQASSVVHFDLVGAYPVTMAEQTPAFFQEIVLRMVTRVSTHEVTDHQVVGTPIPAAEWRAARTPGLMLAAARELDRRNFFTATAYIHELVDVPVVSDAVSSQYSEGCFASWDPDLAGLVATVTGSARPVFKGSITEDDLALIVGVRTDGEGALVRNVEGKRNDPPSSEAVEMIGIDRTLPKIAWISRKGELVQVPVIRSKLHGHRGISAYNPSRVEYVSMDASYYDYPVTCATDAQARGVIAAFARSEALNNPADPRQVVFTILPTHGVLIVEKWVQQAAPFQTIWEYFDLGHLVLEARVPQGPLQYVEMSGRRVLKELVRSSLSAS